MESSQIAVFFFSLAVTCDGGCWNGGECSAVNGVAKCICPSSWTGSKCQEGLFMAVFNCPVNAIAQRHQLELVISLLKTFTCLSASQTPSQWIEISSLPLPPQPTEHFQFGFVLLFLKRTQLICHVCCCYYLLWLCGKCTFVPSGHGKIR